MLLWLAYRAWNLFNDPQGDCLGRRGTFLSCDFGLPRTGLSSVLHSGSMDSLRPSSDTSSSLTWTLGLEWNGPKPVEPSDPTFIIHQLPQTFFFFFAWNQLHQTVNEKLAYIHHFQSFWLTYLKLDIHHVSKIGLCTIYIDHVPPIFPFVLYNPITFPWQKKMYTFVRIAK